MIVAVIFFSIVLGLFIAYTVERTSTFITEKVKTYPQEDYGWKPIGWSLLGILIAVIFWFILGTGALVVLMSL